MISMKMYPRLMKQMVREGSDPEDDEINFHLDLISANALPPHEQNKNSR